MSANNVWFPFYVGDYLADTMHLSTLEHGAYDLLLFAYYKNQGPLPDDDARLCRITKLSVSDWGATRSVVAEFFQVRDGKWFHKRVDVEIKKRMSAQVARQQAAAHTNELRWGERSLNQSPTRSPCRKTVAIPQSQSQSEVQKKKNTSDDALQIYELYPRKVAKPKALNSIRRALKVHGFDVIHSATKRFSEAWSSASKDELTFCPHPTTWFNGERFMDSPETWKPERPTPQVNGHHKPQSLSYIESELRAIEKDLEQ